MMVKTINPPPAVPCKALPTINIFMVLASAQMMELPKKNATADKMMNFRPQMSDTLAQIGPAAALAREYADMIQT